MENLILMLERLTYGVLCFYLVVAIILWLVWPVNDNQQQAPLMVFIRWIKQWSGSKDESP